MAWSRLTWVDDDGSLTVGTAYTAARMNNIEEGIEAAISTAPGWTPNLSTNMKVTSPGSVKRIGGAGEWTEQVYSSESYARGCYVSFRPAVATDHMMIGLNTDPTTDAVYTSIDYAIFCSASGAVQIYEGGVKKAEGFTYTTSDIFSITYDGTTVRYWKNGTLLREVARAIGSPLFLDSSFGSVNSEAAQMEFGPMGEKGEQGGTGEQGEAAPMLERAGTSHPTAGTGNLEWKHAVDSSIQGVLVLIAQNATAADQISGVTFGGVAMEEISGSPFAHVEGSEDAEIYAYFLGKGVPGGNAFITEQTVKVTVTGAATKQALCITFKADRDLRIEDTATVDSASSAGPELSFNLGSDVTLQYGVFHLGVASELSASPANAGIKSLFVHDFGEQIAMWVEQEQARVGAEGASVNLGVIQTLDEAGAFGVVVGRVRDFGLVTSLPSVAGKGDTCRYLVDAANGIIWDFIYTGEGEYPWAAIGPTPVNKTAGLASGQTTKSSASWADLSTKGPEYAVPLAGEYEIEFGCTGGINAGALNNYIGMNVSIGGGTPNEEDRAINLIQTLSVLNSVVGHPVKRILAASGVIKAQYRLFLNAGEPTGFFQDRWLRVRPIRVK